MRIPTTGCHARLGLALLMASLTGCTTTVLIQSYSVPAPNPVGYSWVGVSKVDITPPPGFPTGGHGPAGSLARGYWSRLYARTFFFEDKCGHVLILVSCDLFAIPAGLQQLVAREVAIKAAKLKVSVSVPPEALILAATHTHQSPGNFMTAELYNEYGSKWPGFSQRLFDFLVDRITCGIVEAIENTQHADTAATDFELDIHVGSLVDVVRSRSPRVFLLNHDAADIMNLNPKIAKCEEERWESEPEDAWTLSGCPRLRAVDRRATVVEIKATTVQGCGTTVGIMVFFASHPTVMADNAPLYSSDFVGAAVSAMERARPGPPAVVVGFFNGPEGDVTARRTSRDLRDVLDVAGRMVCGLDAALGSTAVKAITDPPITVVRTGQGVVPPCPDFAVPDPANPKVPKPPELATAPLMGVAALGGGEDDHTVLYSLGWREGVRDRALNGQGPKLPALDSQLLRGVKLSAWGEAPYKFSRRPEVVVARLGDFGLAALPVEMSTAQAFHIREALGIDIDKRWQLEIIGLANDYSGYTASPWEYAAQDYMGASTVWGPSEGPFLGCLIESAWNAKPNQSSRIVNEEEYRQLALPDESFGLSFVGDERVSDDEELESIVTSEPGIPDRHLPFFEWTECQTRPDTPSNEDCGVGLWDGSMFLDSTTVELDRTAARHVRMLVWDGSVWKVRQVNGVPDDDYGFNFISLIRHAPTADERFARKWVAIWLAPLWEPEPTEGTYAFWVYRGDGQSPVCSKPFPVQTPSGVPRAVPIGDCPSVAP